MSELTSRPLPEEAGNTPGLYRILFQINTDLDSKTVPYRYFRHRSVFKNISLSQRRNVPYSYTQDVPFLKSSLFFRVLQTCGHRHVSGCSTLRSSVCFGVLRTCGHRHVSGCSTLRSSVCFRVLRTCGHRHVSGCSTLRSPACSHHFAAHSEALPRRMRRPWSSP